MLIVGFCFKISLMVNLGGPAGAAGAGVVVDDVSFDVLRSRDLRVSLLYLKLIGNLRLEFL